MTITYLSRISLILVNLIRNTPGAIRTRDPLLRRQMLYPAELQTHIFSIFCLLVICCIHLLIKILIMKHFENNYLFNSLAKLPRELHFTKITHQLFFASIFITTIN